jgi:hypothetical protein
VDHGTRRWSRIGSLCRLLREPQGSLAHGLNFLCPCTCTAETHPACPCSYPQGRRAWPQPLCATSVLLPHQRPPACSRVVCCLAHALACGIEPSRPLTKHFRSHSRTRRFNSARTSGSYNSAALSICCDAIRTGLPPPPVLRCASNPRRVAPAPTASCRYIASPSDSPRHNRHLCLREGRGLPASGPCLPLPSPRRPPTSSTRGLAAPVRNRPQPSHCSSSRTARDFPAHRHPARHATAPPLCASSSCCWTRARPGLAPAARPAPALRQLPHTTASCGLGSPGLHAAATMLPARSSACAALRTPPARSAPTHAASSAPTHAARSTLEPPRQLARTCAPTRLRRLDPPCASACCGRSHPRARSARAA